jgi:hypothetical protein
MESKHDEDPDAYPMPRGIAIERETGAWALPVKFGVNSSSQVHAQQQLIDHNSLNLVGGGFDPLEVARMYDQQAYVNILAQISAGAEDAGIDLTDGLTATVTADDFTLLAQIAEQMGSDLEFQAPDGISLGGEVEGGFSEGEGDEEEEEADTPPESGVRMLQLFLDTKSHPEMMMMLEALNPKLQAQNPTDCILKAVREIYSQLIPQSE